MKNSNILLVVTSADRMGSAPEPTGYWLEEVVAPYYTFLDARCSVTIASPKGGTPPCDANSLTEEAQTASTRRYHADSKAQMALRNTVALNDVNARDYDGIFFAGGHGTMEDLPHDANVIRLVEQFYKEGKPVASVCHGPACLVNAKNPKGEPIIKGKRFTCFSDAEEIHIGVDKFVPFMLETRLKEQGGTPQNKGLFEANTVVDGNLITGQNPASSIPAAEAVIYQTRQRLAA